MTDEEPHLTTTEARAGATPHMTRVILVVSLLLIVAIFGVLFWVWSG
jgi:flagellar biogenesis protein FliO